MAIPEKIRRHGKGLNKITVYIDDKTLEVLASAYKNNFSKIYGTFSAYVRSVLEEYTNSSYLAQYLR